MNESSRTLFEDLGENRVPAVDVFSIILLTILGSRFVLKIIGETPQSPLLANFYNLTEFLVVPFNTLVSKINVGNGTIEIGTLSAILFYMIAAYSLTLLINFVSGNYENRRLYR